MKKAWRTPEASPILRNCSHDGKVLCLQAVPHRHKMSFIGGSEVAMLRGFIAKPKRSAPMLTAVVRPEIIDAPASVAPGPDCCMDSPALVECRHSRPDVWTTIEAPVKGADSLPRPPRFSAICGTGAPHISWITITIGNKQISPARRRQFVWATVARKSVNSLMLNPVFTEICRRGGKEAALLFGLVVEPDCVKHAVLIDDKVHKGLI